MWQKLKEVILPHILELTFPKVLSLSILLLSPLLLYLRKVLGKVDLNVYKTAILLSAGVLLPTCIISLAYIYLSKRRIPFMGVLWDSKGNAYCPSDKTMLSPSAPLNYRSMLQADSRHICTKCGHEIYFMIDGFFADRAAVFRSLQQSLKK